MRALKGRRLLFALLVVFLIAVVPSIVVPTLMCRRPDPVFEGYGVVPKFAFVDETGATVTEESFRHHATVVDFIFTRCDTICPVTSMKFERLQEHLFDVARRVKLISISVDPKYDTPERLAAYAKQYSANPDQWHFLTGDPAAIKAIAEGPFANSVQRDPDLPSGAPSIAHNGYFVLVDPELHIRGFYDSNDVMKLDALVRDARFLSRTMK